MVHQEIARLIPMAQSLALAAENVRVVKKKEKSMEDIVGLGVTNIVGISLIGVTSDLVESL